MKFINILLYSPGWRVKKIKVPTAAKVSSLDAFFQNTSVNFVYKGIVVCKNLTFDFYNVASDDIFITVPEIIPKEKINDRIFSLSNAPSLKFITNISIARESTKKNDLFLSNMDLRPKKFRHIVKCMQNRTNYDELKPKIEVVAPENAKVISTEPLPCFWGCSPTNAKKIIQPVSSIVVDDNEISNNNEKVI